MVDRIDATDEIGLRTCLVCGLIYDDFYPWDEDGESPTFEFCDCCGVEFGYGDNNPDAARAWRDRWLAGDADWFRPKAQPADWDLEKQLSQIPRAWR